MIKLNTTAYQYIHNWVRENLGVPKKCEQCGKEGEVRFQWANISGEYKKELLDWKRMCVPCHKNMDNFKKYKDHCKREHEFTKENTYLKPSNKKNRICKKCVSIRKEQERDFLIKIGVYKKKNKS